MMDENELLFDTIYDKTRGVDIEEFRKSCIIIGDLIIQYEGETIDTFEGRCERWTIIHKLPFIENEGGDD